MGLSNSHSDRQTFVNVIGGKFSISVDKSTEGAVSRQNKKDVTVWELQYDTLDKVKIIGIEKKIGEFGASYEVKLKDFDREFILNLPYSGRVTNGLMFRLPNINLSEEVTLKTFKDKDTDKAVLFVTQGGKTVPAAYTKDNPNGLPPMVQRKVKGVDTWDDTAQGEFIENMIVNTIVPKFKSQPAIPEVSQEVEDTSSDLPFIWLLLPFILPLIGLVS